MTGSINPVWPGYPYTLVMTLDPAVAPASARLRIDLHGAGQPPAAAIPVTLVHQPAGVHTLALTAAQTATLRRGALVGDLVLRRGDGHEVPLNLRLTIPVEPCLTAPEG